MWQLGYDSEDWQKPPDAKVVSATLRHGNFDYVTNVGLEPTLRPNWPPSLYLTGKPAFFRSEPWPSVTPESGNRVATLPARAPFDQLHRQ